MVCRSCAGYVLRKSAKYILSKKQELVPNAGGLAMPQMRYNPKNNRWVVVLMAFGTRTLRAVNANWNSSGWNMNAYSVANPNEWNGGRRVFSRNSCISPAYRAGVFCSMPRLHPPSIRPISFKSSDNSVYVAVCRILSSHAICRKNFNKSNLPFAFARMGGFCSFWRYCAIKSSSSMSKKRASIFAPMVKRICFGIVLRAIFHSLYTAMNLCMMGKIPVGGGRRGMIIMKTQLSHSYEDIISVENLLEAWREFAKGKTGRADVQEFSLRLMDNILLLHNDLCHHTYRHGSYQAFAVHDPKPRRIHKAGVRDRLLHHAIHRVLYPFFDRVFIVDSFSCRNGKGTHTALNRFRALAYRAGKNNTRTVWVLKCDIKKFFASIDHKILLRILWRYIPDAGIMRLLECVVKSFFSVSSGKGLPLGNLTSQLFANTYMNEFDRFMKHSMKAKYYIRYADDFVILSDNREWLAGLVSRIRIFLSAELKLVLHPDKVLIKTVVSGVDFLGWVHFPDHRVLRTATRRRMFKKLHERASDNTLHSYFGLLRYGNTYGIREKVMAEWS